MKAAPFFQSVRFRLAVTYSLIVFGLAFVAIAGVNLAISRTLDEEPVSERSDVYAVVQPDGSFLVVEDRYRSVMANLERLVNLRALQNLRRFSLWALVVMFPASIGLGWLIADRALRPIGRIAGVAREIQASDMSRRIDLEGPSDELKELADTFDNMLNRVEAGVAAQRDFIEDTSHELRNPLAVMRTNLDVALADPQADAATLRAAAEVVRRTLDRTARTVDDLIVYARREVTPTEAEAVDLYDLVAELAEEYAATAADRDVEILATPSAHPVAVVSDRANVKQAVVNLIRNAVAVAPAGTAVRVESGAEEDWAYIKVRDQGPGIEEADHTRIFERSWSKSVGGKEGGTGLGLAIARQLATAAGGTVTVRSSREAGAEFAVWLPRNEGAAIATVSTDGIHH